MAPVQTASRVSVRVSPLAGCVGGVQLRLFVCAQQRQPRRQRKGVAAEAAALRSATVAFDLGSFGDAMTGAECAALAKQLAQCYGYNRQLPAPFRLALCGLESASIRPVLDALGTHQWDRWVLSHANAAPWIAFPRGSIIYLSADAPQVLCGFGESDVLVIGGLIDHSNADDRRGGALRVAQAAGVRAARLPLDEFVTVRAQPGVHVASHAHAHVPHTDAHSRVRRCARPA